MSDMLPPTMRAIAIEPSGSKDGRLVLCERPVPMPAPHELLIKVEYAGVNRADILQRKGHYPPPAGASDLPGLEVAGTVVATGSEAAPWQVGDTVCALLSGGGYAAYATAAAAQCLPVPHGWHLREAAALPEALFTVWMALGAEAELRAQDALLIHGGASGIGMMAIQYAAALGATVITTASSAEKCVECMNWGATLAIPYHERDFVQEVLAATDGKGADVVLDFIGGDYIERNFAAMATDGRMISLAFLRGARLPAFNMAPILLKRLTWKGATLRNRSDAQKAIYANEMMKNMWPFIEQGRIRPHIHDVFPLVDAQKAHKTMEQNLNIGKIVLQV